MEAVQPPRKLKLLHISTRILQARTDVVFALLFTLGHTLYKLQEKKMAYTINSVPMLYLPLKGQINPINKNFSEKLLPTISPRIEAPNLNTRKAV